MFSSGAMVFYVWLGSSLHEAFASVEVFFDFLYVPNAEYHNPVAFFYLCGTVYELSFPVAYKSAQGYVGRKPQVFNLFTCYFCVFCNNKLSKSNT